MVRHLGFAEMAPQAPGRRPRALEESARLRQEIGFAPGVAAGVLALAELAARAGDRDRALALLDEATAIAADAGARGILRWAGQAPPRTMTSVPDRTVRGSCAQSWR